MTLGAWVLPQPIDTTTYVSIPKIGRTIPFGYKEGVDEGWLDPIPNELEALEKAKKHLKQYSSRDVSAWLTKLTGRTISHVGLLKRIKDEQSRKRKSATYRKLAKRYEEALRKAEEYEKRIGGKEDDKYFSTDKYKNIRASFGELSSDRIAEHRI
jgi:hypothetical protein